MLHLEHAIAIVLRAPDPADWPALVDQVPEPAREPCRQWLEAEAARRAMQAKPGRNRKSRCNL